MIEHAVSRQSHDVGDRSHDLDRKVQTTSQSMAILWPSGPITHAAIRLTVPRRGLVEAEHAVQNRDLIVTQGLLACLMELKEALCISRRKERKETEGWRRKSGAR